MTNEPSNTHPERELAAALVRGLAAVDDLLQAQYASSVFRETPDRVAERLEETVAARLEVMAAACGEEVLSDATIVLGVAIDNLGRGESLDPWDVLAFRAPVASRSDRMILSDEPSLSSDIEAVKARLLRRGVTVLDEREYRGDRTLTVSSYVSDWAHEALAELLPGVEVDWVGRTPRETVPARCVGWRDKGGDMIRVWVSVRDDQHIDEVIVAESDEEIVVLPFVCCPSAGWTGRRHEDPAHIHLRAPLGDRAVVCGFSGQPLRHD